MKIAVVDDCIEQLNYYSKDIKDEFSRQYGQVDLWQFSDVAGMDSDYDILFTDVKMPKKDGITFAKECKRMKKDLIIVFISDYDSYVWESFSAGAIYYLRKKYFQQELWQVVKRCVELYEEQHQMLVLESGKHTVQYQMKDICYVEANGKNVLIYSMGETVEIRAAFSEVERQLPKLQFIKIHRSYLVNYEYIRELSSGKVELLNGTKLPISKYRMQQVREQYLQCVK